MRTMMELVYVGQKGQKSFATSRPWLVRPGIYAERWQYCHEIGPRDWNSCGAAWLDNDASIDFEQMAGTVS